MSQSGFDTLGGERLGALLQLSSPALPVGAYAYSQGLESAVHAGRVSNEAQARVWIGDYLRLVLGRFDAPVWLRLYRACRDHDRQAFETWNARYLASRETRELRSETLQLGYSMLKLMDGLDEPFAFDRETVSWPAAHAWACRSWGIGAEPGLIGFLYGHLDNLVTASLKAIPLGQLSGQRILHGLRPVLAEVAGEADRLADEALATQAVGLALFSSRHEDQYSRLFRS